MTYEETTKELAVLVNTWIDQKVTVDVMLAVLSVATVQMRVHYVHSLVNSTETKELK